MIKNLANTKPPEFVKINGNIHPVNYHYLTWIEIVSLFDDIDFDNLFTGEDRESLAEDLETIAKIEGLAFGSVLDEPPLDALRAITGFAAGYPQPHGNDSEPPKRRLFDFEADLNSIIIAIRDQSGIDLSKTEEPYHWWRFLLEFNNLSGDHHICKLMELRSYDGKDKDMIKAREAVALPVKISKKQQRFEDEADAIFYNC